MLRLGADEARLGRVGEFIWLALAASAHRLRTFCFGWEFKAQGEQFSVHGSQFVEKPVEGCVETGGLGTENRQFLYRVRLNNGTAKASVTKGENRQVT